MNLYVFQSTFWDLGNLSFWKSMKYMDVALNLQTTMA